MAEGAKPLRCQKLLSHLTRKFGIVRVRQRGSHILLLKPEHPGSTKGPTHPVSCHNPNDEVSPHIVKAILRTFSIDPDDFWKGL